MLMIVNEATVTAELDLNSQRLGTIPAGTEITCVEEDSVVVDPSDDSVTVTRYRITAEQVSLTLTRTPG